MRDKNLSEMLTELDNREYEEFWLRSDFAIWQENEIYGKGSEDVVCEM